MNLSDSNRGLNQKKTQGVRHGVVAVCCEGNKYLVIRRSQLVRAPGLLCFPGGHIEADESAMQAVIREMQEELALPIEVIKHLWSSITAWGTHLEWIYVRRPASHDPVPNPEEVADVMWMTESELLGSLDILGSVSDFFEAKYSGAFSLES